MLWKSCFHKQTLVVWSRLVPGNSLTLGTQGDPQHTLSWGHGKHPNHNTVHQGGGLTRNFRRFSLSGLHSFSKQVLWSIFIPTRTTDTQRKYIIPIIKLSTQVFTVSANNYTLSAANFAQSNQTLYEKLWIFLSSNLPSVSCQQTLPRCRKFALCPFDFYSGDTSLRGVI